MSELPQGWELVQLGFVGTWGSGGTPKRTNEGYYAAKGIPWLVIGDLTDGLVVKSANSLTELGLQNSSAKLLPIGTLLVAMYGSIGKLGITGIECATNQAIAFCRPNEAVVSLRYLYHALFDAKPRLLALGQGGAQQNISQSVLKDFQIALAPKNEQTRIANQLDTLLARIQACNDRFDAIPALLKRFRQNVLDACFLDDQLAVPVEKSIQPWALRTVGSVCASISDGPFGSNLKSADYTSAGVQVVRLENIGHLFFDAEKETFISAEKYKTLSKHTLKKGDLLFSSFVDEEVRVCEFPIGTLTINKADCFRLRVDETQCNRHFLLYRLACKSTYQSLKDQVHGATRPRINLTQLRGYEILLPPLAKQAEIVRRVEALFALADRIEARCTAARTQAQRLTPLVLAKAFRGELVPQDPNDEPASALLARIASSNTAVAGKNKRKVHEVRKERAQEAINL